MLVGLKKKIIIIIIMNSKIYMYMNVSTIRAGICQDHLPITVQMTTKSGVGKSKESNC